MRREYLAMAEEDPDRWFVVDNARASVEENSDLIAERILRDLGKDVSLHDPSRYKPYLDMDASGISPDDTRGWCSAFYGYLNGLIAEGRHQEAVYHARSIESDEAWAIRDRLVDEAPEVLVYGLGPLSSERAIAMRWRLIDEVPGRVARSLSDIWANDHEEAWKMREALADKVPDEVAMSIGRFDTERAWALRDRLKQASPGLVLASLKGFDTERAWALRDELSKKKNVPGLLRGLAYIDTENAWRVRDKHSKNALPWVIMSTLGCESERAYALRRKYLDGATKLVIRSLAGSETGEAWEMRREAGPWAKETLTTIKNIDSDEAWALRKSLSDTWPGPAAKSVGLMHGLTPKGYDFILDLACRHPHNPDVVHYLVKLIEVKKGRSA